MFCQAAQQPCVSICLCSALGRAPIQLLKLHFLSQTACVLGFMEKLFLRGHTFM